MSTLQELRRKLLIVLCVTICQCNHTSKNGQTQMGSDGIITIMPSHGANYYNYMKVSIILDPLILRLLRNELVGPKRGQEIHRKINRVN